MIWRHLGFEKDIFFVTPLNPIEEDINLFVGREDEIKKFLLDTLNGDRSLKVISGKIGVGKTTFVNACQYYSFANLPPNNIQFNLLKILPCYQKIQLSDNDSLQSFILKTLTSITNSIKKTSDLNKIQIRSDVKEIVDYFQNISLSTSSGSGSIGASFAGYGGTLSVGTATKIFRDSFNPRQYLEILVNYVKETYQVEGVFVLVNNLDILSKKLIVTLVNEARDVLFDMPGIYWILIGQEGLGSLIESECDRVSDYLSGTESKIKPLTKNKLIEISQIRTEKLALNNYSKCPLPQTALEIFYDMSLKELRSTFRICGEVVKRVIGKEPSLREISLNTAIDAFVSYAEERAKQLDLTENNIKILSDVYSKTNCRPKDFKQFGYDSSAGFISALQSLVKKQLLSVEEKGKARIYYPTGMTMIAGITGALGREIQKIARDQFDRAKSGSRIMERPVEEMGQLSLFEEEE